MTASKLYYECHITIDPVFDARREKAAELALKFKFKLAKLIMRKREADVESAAKDDTFMTGHGRDLDDIQQRMVDLVNALNNHGFNVRRYKIEDTILDSRCEDCLNLIRRAA